MSVKGKPLKPVHPNAGLEALYRKRLEALVDEMHKSLDYWIGLAYRANTPEMALDASPAAMLRAMMKKLSRRWQAKFNKLATQLGKHFAVESAKRVDGQLAAMLKEAGMTVAFKMTPTMNDVMQATIGEQVGLIRSIGAQYLSEVQGLVMRSVTVGGDMHTLSKELRKRYRVTRKRAALIARDQNNKATATLTRVRQTELGITKAKWLHSSAGRTPRPEHVKWNDKPYDISKGMWSEVDKRYVWPGTSINCRCVSIPIIPGLQ